MAHEVLEFIVDGLGGDDACFHPVGDPLEKIVAALELSGRSFDRVTTIQRIEPS
jgi:hypothetical protein